jgi:hypothetical protein
MNGEIVSIKNFSTKSLMCLKMHVFNNIRLFQYFATILHLRFWYLPWFFYNYSIFCVLWSEILPWCFLNYSILYVLYFEIFERKNSVVKFPDCSTISPWSIRYHVKNFGPYIEGILYTKLFVDFFLCCNCFIL